MPRCTATCRQNSRSLRQNAAANAPAPQSVTVTPGPPMPLTRGRPAGPVSPSLQRAVESLTPTSAAELAHAARQRTEHDALKTLALFLDEPATAESVVMVRARLPRALACLLTLYSVLPLTHAPSPRTPNPS